LRSARAGRRRLKAEAAQRVPALCCLLSSRSCFGAPRRLVRDADVFVTNAPLDSRARLHVRYEGLAPLNARLIYALSRNDHGRPSSAASKAAKPTSATSGSVMLCTPCHRIEHTKPRVYSSKG
jgi:hypothetical protein